MRILTVRQPWAHAIIHGGKDVENRVRNLAGSYRGPVAIHAGLRLDEEAMFGDSLPGRLLDKIPNAEAQRVKTLGAIIGVVELVDVHVGPEFGGGCHKLTSPLPVLPTYGLCSPWGEAGSYHLVFANPRALDQPIPYKGGLGLRKFPFEVMGDHLVEYVAKCTCGMSQISFQHEPLCGVEMVARLEVSRG